MTKEKLISKVVDYADKVFFYCIKRCDNRLDAEDLSQTILLECIININKGTIIENLDYYIWGICKNQFNLYLRNKINKDNITDELDETTIQANELTPLDSLIESEKIHAINTSIKLLSKDYSQILYAYYIEDKTIKNIAEELKLPLGTVCRKLKEIRDKLKEYVVMERINGKKAFVPKEYNSRRSGGSSSHNPEQYVTSLIHQNVLLHSYDNPSTIEDYSLEMGISLPYIENIVKILCDATLLTKTKDGKYLTNFVMIDKNLNYKLIKYIKDNSHEYAELIANYCKQNINSWKLLLNNDLINDNNLMWSFMFNISHIVEMYELDEEENKNYQPFRSRHIFEDGSWNFMLYETSDNNKLQECISEMYDSNNIYGISAYYYPTSEDSISESECIKSLSYDVSSNYEADLEVLGYISKNQDLKYSDCTYTLKTAVDKMIKENYIKVINDKLFFNFPYLNHDKWQINKTKIRYDENLKEAKLKRREIIEELKEIIKRYIPNYLNVDLDYIANSYFVGYMRIHVVKYFEDSKIIEANKEKNRFTYNMIAYENI